MIRRAGLGVVASVAFACASRLALGQAEPAVILTRPADGETGVARDTFVAADVFVPTGGIDAATLTSQSVYLRRDGDVSGVPAVLNTSGAGDVIVLRPVSLLEANTSYTFVVTSELRDVAGASLTDERPLRHGHGDRRGRRPGRLREDGARHASGSGADLRAVIRVETPTVETATRGGDRVCR
jgi:hypothetical protein